LKLSRGATATLNLQLDVAGGKTEINVTGAVGTVSTNDAQVGDILSPNQIEKTPLPNCRITYLPLLHTANHPAINQGDVFMESESLHYQWYRPETSVV